MSRNPLTARVIPVWVFIVVAFIALAFGYLWGQSPVLKLTPATPTPAVTATP